MIERRGIPRRLMLPIGALALASALWGSALPASAEGGGAPPAGPLLLDLMSQPVESQEAAFSASLRRDAGPAPARRADAPEVLPDGSLRYGRSTLGVVIKNPCPEGDLAHEAKLSPPLGRPLR
ncbi:MAG: hypothetical protein A2X52_03415 [Candidatus Rokubacteria bacterium GWC2_70_16]|nr:MAG: hypothetical protein A2X52_03415 [Candidatus Rokubacteria bacterium GWC2_70_16]OGL14599.1 MAG: hypothetical protein A3K12_07965 [Candidatus Rokubacteria bacterium RIFCSPLOWO2_12_FULL_71_19]